MTQDQDCHNCKHTDSNPYDEPCVSCTSITCYTKWEPILC